MLETTPYLVSGKWTLAALVLPLDFLEKLLLLGFLLILAALIGGGLDAANIVRIPVLTDGRVRAGVGLFGAIIMAVTYSWIGQAGSDQYRAAFAAAYDKLVMGAAGIPKPPPWPDKAVMDELEVLSVHAGKDAGMNCEIANFMSVHRIPVTYWPNTLHQRVVEASTGIGGPELDCYRLAIKAATQERVRNSCGPTVVSDATNDPFEPQTRLNETLPVRNLSSRLEFVSIEPRVALSDRRDGPVTLAQSAEIAPRTASTSILEAITSVGERGWVFIGVTESGRLGAYRTIAEDTVTVGAVVTVVRPVNLRSAETGSDYRNHRILSVLAPGSKILVRAMSSPDSTYRWAYVQVLSIPH